MSIYQTTLSSPIGDLILGVVEDSVCLLEFHDRRMLPTQIERVSRLFNQEIEEAYHPLQKEAQHQLDEYFAGARKEFTLPLKYPGSTFQQKVWECLRQIPYGITRSYLQQSELMGDKKAIRAMAKANGDNRIAIIIPCHRVIGSNGDLVGYGGKLWRKKHLLELEGAFAKQGELF